MTTTGYHVPARLIDLLRKAMSDGWYEDHGGWNEVKELLKQAAPTPILSAEVEARIADAIATLRRERDEAREWSRLRDADIMTLGRELGEARAEVERLHDALLNGLDDATKAQAHARWQRDAAQAEVERLTRERDELEGYLIDGAYKYGNAEAEVERLTRERDEALQEIHELKVALFQAGGGDDPGEPALAKAPTDA